MLVKLLDRKRKLDKSLPDYMITKETAVNPEIYGSLPTYVTNNDHRYNIIIVVSLLEEWFRSQYCVVHRSFGINPKKEP